MGNAAEHWVAVSFALRDKIALSINIAVGSAAQIALFVAPVLVLVLASFAVGPFPIALRTQTAGGLGSVGEKAAAALADFIVLDMFANFCVGREDIKGAIAVAERQAKRLYRTS